MASENGGEDEDTQKSDNETENESQQTESPPPFTLKVPVNIVRTLMGKGH